MIINIIRPKLASAFRPTVQHETVKPPINGALTLLKGSQRCTNHLLRQTYVRSVSQRKKDLLLPYHQGSGYAYMNGMQSNILHENLAPHKPFFSGRDFSFSISCRLAGSTCGIDTVHYHHCQNDSCNRNMQDQHCN